MALCFNNKISKMEEKKPFHLHFMLCYTRHSLLFLPCIGGARVRSRENSQYSVVVNIFLIRGSERAYNNLTKSHERHIRQYVQKNVSYFIYECANGTQWIWICFISNIFLSLLRRLWYLRRSFYFFLYWFFFRSCVALCE